MWKEFKAFAFKGNVIDLAVGVIIGGAFGKIVSSIVNDLIMPLVGLLTGGANFTNMFVPLKEIPAGTTVTTLEEAVAANIPTLNYGLFITQVIDFLIIALVIFLMIKAISGTKAKMAKKEEAPAAAPTTKVCPFCKTAVDITATRCPACTSNLE
ncbi:MAG: large conductance mechanosensitive channel protein MscL [Saccharofermentanales bacterium]